VLFYLVKNAHPNQTSRRQKFIVLKKEQLKRMRKCWMNFLSFLLVIVKQISPCITHANRFFTVEVRSFCLPSVPLDKNAKIRSCLWLQGVAHHRMSVPRLKPFLSSLRNM